MSEYAFANPEFFWFLLLIPLYVYSIWWQRKHRKTIFLSVFQDLLKVQKKTFRRFVPAIKHVLVILIFCLTVFILARPQLPHDAVKVQKTGVDIFLALDVSESMLAEDLQPNRLEAAKKYISEFVGKLKTDRVGLIVFAGKPFTQSPLTFDYSILDYYLKDISTDSVNQRVRGLNGTAIGDAILLTLSRFKKLEERTRVVVLLTDGDANVGVDPIISAEMARGDGVKIYTIGLGQKGGALIPVGTQNGQKVYAQDATGQYIRTTFNPESLRKIAEATGGQFFHAENNDALQKSFEQIQALEKKEIEAEMSTQYTEKFMPYLWILLSVFSLYFFLEFFFEIQQ